jgi:hypothetical protein
LRIDALVTRAQVKIAFQAEFDTARRIGSAIRNQREDQRHCSSDSSYSRGKEVHTANLVGFHYQFAHRGRDFDKPTAQRGNRTRTPNEMMTGSPGVGRLTHMTFGSHAASRLLAWADRRVGDKTNPRDSSRNRGFI